MLILSSRLENTPIMSLQTGGQIAVTDQPIIDPANLQILGYHLKNNVFSEQESIIRIADIRELSRIGFIVDSGEDFIAPNDVIKIAKVLEFNFNLKGMKVIDQKKNIIGRIEDYTISLDNFTVQQLIIKRPLFKRINISTLTIHRREIVEIDNEKIIIKSETNNSPINRVEQDDNFLPNYINPFRD